MLQHHDPARSIFSPGIAFLHFHSNAWNKLYRSFRNSSQFSLPSEYWLLSELFEIRVYKPPPPASTSLYPSKVQTIPYFPIPSPAQISPPPTSSPSLIHQRLVSISPTYIIDMTRNTPRLNSQHPHEIVNNQAVQVRGCSRQEHLTAEEAVTRKQQPTSRRREHDHCRKARARCENLVPIPRVLVKRKERPLRT
jgi:hypothetical protein